MEPLGCLSCTLFERFDALAQSYARSAFEVLAPSTAMTFNAFVGVWAAYVLVFKGIARGDVDLRDFLQKCAVFGVCGLALGSVDYYWEWLYLPAYEFMVRSSAALVSGPSTNINVANLPEMLQIVEREILRVLGLVRVLIEDGGVTNIVPIIGGLVLAIPFVFVWGIFLAFVLEGIFKLLAITSIAPLLIGAAGFNVTRGFAVTGLRVVIGGILTVVFAAVAMGFTVSIMGQTLGDAVPLGPDGIKAQGVGTFMFSPAYWMLLILGFISVLFHLKAATLASNISGASDGPGAAASVVGAGMAALGALKGAGLYAGKRALEGARGAAGKVGDLARDNRERMWVNAKKGPAAGG